jgi:hypothetical protein
VKSAKTQGIRTGNWLSLRQAQALLSAPDAATVKGLRDRAIIAVLLGCGLRRSEVAALTFAHVQQRDGRWCIVDLVGKHGRVRTAPMPNWVKVAIDAWTSAAVLADARVFRPVNRADQASGEVCRRRSSRNSSSRTRSQRASLATPRTISGVRARSFAGPVVANSNRSKCYWATLRWCTPRTMWSDISDGRMVIARSLKQTKHGLAFKSTKTEDSDVPSRFRNRPYRRWRRIASNRKSFDDSSAPTTEPTWI